MISERIVIDSDIVISSSTVSIVLKSLIFFYTSNPSLWHFLYNHQTVQIKRFINSILISTFNKLVSYFERF
ncbi:hypothetical protein I7I50_03587 [Histoplasma capsulatum G186AR]|uniref:Uncharacterized protein n=1 Tax=Ajellomyces capsulatus TaxID=5037 RepID=A0A8H7YNF3_AJECA|nr:hypothetical protein I7I52_04494 [Histoplasma capsulatum]QSS74693.1 hypothetical protein I7I50_03587 [Histoplasma capsulatum G186AR]